MTTTVSFPGIGILPFNLNRLAFEMGSIKVYWYGIIICLGILLGFLTAYIRMKKIGVTSDDLSDIALICVPSAIVGARLYYVLAEIESYKTLYDVIAVWNGGLAIYGGVIAGVISFTVVCKYKKKPLFKAAKEKEKGKRLGSI